MLKRFITFLNQPYPDNDSLRVMFYSAILAGLIVFLILSLFMPFGLDEVGASSRYLYNLCFGLITATIALCYEVTSKYILKIEKDVESWTLWKWFLGVILLVTLIAIANYLFTNFLFSAAHDWSHFFRTLFSTFTVAIFPIIIFGSINVTRHLIANQSIASAIDIGEKKSKEEFKVSIPIKDSEKTLTLQPRNILYAEAMQNYVMIYTQDGQEVEKELVRNTFTNVANALADSSIIRCHRSFLVNRDRIAEITGNAQGLKIRLDEISNVVIPVSRKYIPVFKP